jgi:aryl-alcohol dehydrogenase-like predicted oxidoreductase
METRKIGPFAVSAIGLGGMPMSVEGRGDWSRSIATIHAALDAGIRHIDTAFGYRLPTDVIAHNELLIGEALRTWSGDASTVLVATKAGHYRHPDEPSGNWGLTNNPTYLKNCARASAKALGVEAIGLFYHHRPDGRVDYADSVGALAELVTEGVIVTAGVSNANSGHIAIAHQVLGANLVAVQNQYSPAFRRTEPDIAVCRQYGLAFLPWSPLGGIGRAGALGAENAVFDQVAAAHGVSPQQVALAWELAKGEHVIPIPGASRPESILDSAKAADLVLTEAELTLLG